MNIGIIAGGGCLPVEVAGLLESRGHSCHLFGIEGELSSDISGFAHTILPWNRIFGLFGLFKKYSIDLVFLVGWIRRRPSLGLFLFDYRSWRFFPVLLRLHSYGDDSILSLCVDIIEGRGYEVGLMSEHLPELLVSGGSNGVHSPGRKDMVCLGHGMEVLGSLGVYDIGQSVVVVGDRVIAVEGAEGTDGMLDRVRFLRQEGRIGGGGVLVKMCKVSQDERVDLPSIGYETIEGVISSGLVGIGVESGKTLIIDRERTVSYADENNIFIYGIDISGL